MRPRILLFTAAAIVIVTLIVLGVADTFLVDFLWFSTLGYRGVFDRVVGTQVAIFAGVWLVSFIAIAASGFAAIAQGRDRERLRVVRRPDEMVEVNLPELLRAFSDRIPWRLLVIVGAAVIAIFPANGEAGGWDTYLKALYGVPFHLGDRSFGHDVGFYIFRLPLLEDFRDLFLVILFLAAAAGIGIHWMRGSLDFRESPPRITPTAAAQISVLLGIFFLQRAFSYYLSRYGLLFHTNGVVYGMRYVDHVLWQPGLWLLVALSIVAAALCFANVGTRGVRLPVIAFVIVFGPSLLLSFIEPVIERLWVKPDELRIEKPYLTANIEMTRAAYQLDNVDVKPFSGQGTLTRASFDTDAATLHNIRLWDPRPLIDTYKQLQEIRLYYDFLDVDIDRYTIGGQYTQVMLSPRELNVGLLPENAQTWVNQHLKFTHGSGLVMSPVNEKDSEGLPVFLIKNIPAESSVGFKVENPAIYFGEEPDNYVVVDSATPEFDYPKGADNVFSFYKGAGGIPVSGLWHRMLFSFFFHDINLLVTENIVDQSKIMIRRNIITRLSYLAPFLRFDGDPYSVLVNGHLVWIVDAYTTSDRYPYSQDIDGLNYIRNSVKAVIDAYDGSTTLYVSDPADPLIQTWQKIFPTMFKPLSSMSDELRAHIRYPEYFFQVQAGIYRTYHMTDPQVFYNREDQWDVAKENYAGMTGPMQPYYIIMRLPGESHEEYILMLPMVPKGRDNMIAWMAARCDGADYGHLFEYAFSKDSLFYGPYQIQARINQNPEISRQLSLWNQMGSKVILGNLIVIPVQDSLLYVEPLYIRAENGQLPELQRVIASYGDRVVMGDTLPETLAALFTGHENAAVPVVAQVTPQTAPNTGAGAPAAPVSGSTAANHYNRALKALSAGNWTEFGTQMQQLGQDLGQNSGGPSH
ncbi:MAG TPA: UPF0182 family protein [Candidatus Binataceae bacterium]|nr:UPF0182 family protein [Candidatus Binataceae bacterium]